MFKPMVGHKTEIVDAIEKVGHARDPAMTAALRSLCCSA